MKVIEFLDASGHLNLEWDPHDEASVARARAEFDSLKAAGYSFFRVVGTEHQGNFPPHYGSLEVRRVDAEHVAPKLESPEPRTPGRRGRPPGAKNKPAEERVIAARPMRGG